MAAGSPVKTNTIFHAFNWRLSPLVHRLGHIRELGYDAVQISPVQKSVGDEWWARYQPMSFSQIEGLGSKEELTDLCARAGEKGIMVVADLVFNHMAVIARREEWKKAQHDTHKKEHLMHQLDTKFKPLDRTDFHPWKDMMGEDWDNEHRFDGWGAGEWSDLKATPKVMKLHTDHIDDLLACGVRGFRFDAAKHIAPETMKRYVDHIVSVCPEAFVYFEVLSDSMQMHALSTPTAPTTDFPLCYALRKVARGETCTSKLLDLPTVSSDSIRFVRNHDTIMNHDFDRSHGYRKTDPACALAWVFLLSFGGGSALVFPEDEEMCINKGKPVQAALKFRRAMLDRGNPAPKVLLFNHTVASTGAPASSTSREHVLRSPSPGATKEGTGGAEAQGARDDADELEELAAASKRRGVQIVLRLQAAQLRRKADQMGGRTQKPSHSPSKAGGGHGGEGKALGEKEKDKLVVVARGKEGFTVINFANEWVDLPSFQITGSELEGVYHDEVYGFDVTIDASHTITSWGSSRGERRVKIGAMSALVLVRKTDHFVV